MVQTFVCDVSFVIICWFSNVSVTQIAYVKVKVNQFRYRPGVVQRVPGS